MIEVIGNREERHEDLRWSTRNTKLASALLVLGFQLSATQPFTTLISGRGTTTVTIWFFPYIDKDGEGLALEKALTARQVEVEWATTSDRMPFLYFMRRALEARDYIIREVIGKGQLPMSGTSIKKAMYITDSIRDASVALSCNAKLHGYLDRKFYLEAKAELMISNANRQDYAGREAWALKAIMQQTLLMNVIKGREKESTLVRVAGAFGTAWIPAAMSPRDKESYLQKIDLGK